MAKSSSIGAALVVSVALCAGPTMAAGTPPGLSGIPDFSSNNMGWVSNGVEFDPVPDEKAVPNHEDPAYPHCGNRISPRCGNVITPAISDTTNPILQPWVAAQMAQTNKELLAGKDSFFAMSRCFPGGVPGMLLFTAEPTYFLQMPDEVTMLYSRGPNIRHVYMNVPHTKNPPPTWLGESVGHYDGDELVIDTIGLNDKTFIDSYHTPHTDKLHVIERYKLIDGGKTMLATVTIDDPGAFTTQWSGTHSFTRHTTPIAESESICAESNDVNYFHEDLVPIPQAGIPDF